VKRLTSAGIPKVVVGISGGLDSTQALIVAARAMDLLDYPRTNIKAYTMPGFATSTRTLTNANALMEAIGCEATKWTFGRAASRCCATCTIPMRVESSCMT